MLRFPSTAFFSDFPEPRPWEFLVQALAPGSLDFLSMLQAHVGLPSAVAASPAPSGGPAASSAAAAAPVAGAGRYVSASAAAAGAAAGGSGPVAAAGQGEYGGLMPSLDEPEEDEQLEEAEEEYHGQQEEEEEGEEAAAAEEVVEKSCVTHNARSSGPWRACGLAETQASRSLCRQQRVRQLLRKNLNCAALHPASVSCIGRGRGKLY